MFTHIDDIESALARYESDWEVGWYHWRDTRNEPALVLGVGLVETVDDHGGGEGNGDETWVVVQVTDVETGDVTYYRKNGYYSSFDGTDWDGSFTEVTPSERTITVYE